MKTLTINDIAKETGLHRETVNKRLTHAKPDETQPWPRFSWRTILQAWADYERTVLTADGVEVIDYNKEKARLTKAQADKAEYENRLREGELVEAEVIENQYTERVVLCRQKLLGIPQRASRDIAGMDDSIKIQQILHEEITDALHELTKEVAKLPIEEEAPDPAMVPKKKGKPGRPKKK